MPTTCLPTVLTSYAISLSVVGAYLGCACFPEFLQNFSERQSLCLVVFHAFTLGLPIQTSLSVAPELQVPLRSGEKTENFRKTSTPGGVLNSVNFRTGALCRGPR